MPVRVVLLDALSVVPYYTGHLCAHLAQAEGVRVWPACITYHHDPEFFARLGIRTDPGLCDLAWRAPAPLRRAAKLGEYLANLAVLLARFLRERPDVIHVQFLPLLQWRFPAERWFLRLVRALGIKVVYTVHNVLPQDRGDRLRGAYQRVYQLADRLICHDREAASRLDREFGIRSGRIDIIPHGPLFEEAPGTRAEARARLGFAPDACVFLWQGILRPYKGVSFLLKAWPAVCAANREAILAIVGGGDPEMLGDVAREASAPSLRGRVRLDLRFVSREELADYLDAADALVYPYREITTSGALMTGLTRGKAVVATALPAFKRMLVHGENAWLVPYGDVGALAAALVRLAGDSALRKRLGDALFASQSQLPRWPEIAIRTRECYLQALGAPVAGRVPATPAGSIRP